MRLHRLVGLIASVSVGAGGARAQTGKVVLVGEEAPLARALSTALEPWNVAVVEVRAEAPGGTADARNLGGAHGAQAVVWVRRLDEALALSMFDVGADQIIERRLAAGRPMDDELAAAAALSVKTMLRFTALSPPRERFGAQAGTASPVRRAFSVEASGGARMLADAQARLEPRFGLALAYFPAALRGAVGIAVAAQGGSGIAVRSEAFVGRHGETAGAIQLRARRELGRWLLEPALGASLRFATLDGATTAGGPARESRLNPALEGGGRVAVRAGQLLEIGLRLGAGYALRRQRYLVRGEPILLLPALALQGELSATVPLF